MLNWSNNNMRIDPGMWHAASIISQDNFIKQKDIPFHSFVCYVLLRKFGRQCGGGHQSIISHLVHLHRHRHQGSFTFTISFPFFYPNVGILRLCSFHEETLSVYIYTPQYSSLLKIKELAYKWHIVLHSPYFLFGWNSFILFPLYFTTSNSLSTP